MTTTIHSLPDEVLLHIFTTAIHTGRGYTLFPQFNDSQVCRRWRSVALSYPFLWNNISLATWRGENDTDRWFRIGTTFFQRSSPLPVDVVIKDRDDRLPLLKLLEPYSSRIRSLDLNRVTAKFSDIKLLLERIGPHASNLRSMKLPRRQEGHWHAQPPTEASHPSAMRLESLAVPRKTCLECLPFPLGSVTQLELNLFFPTCSGMAFLFSNMPRLSSLVIDLDYSATATQHHFYSHDPAIDDETSTSTLIPGSSSLQKLALHFGWDDTESTACMSALELLDVQNVKYLELSQYYVLDENPYQSVMQAWKDRLFSLETLVLPSVDEWRGILGDEQKRIHSSHPAGVKVITQTAPSFETHRRIMSSFTKIASITYYIQRERSTRRMGPYKGVPEAVKEACNVSFPITFLSTPEWYDGIDEEYIYNASDPTDDQEVFEAVDFIRHFIKIAKGGQIPVRFINSRSSLPTLLSETEVDCREEELDHIADTWDD